MAHPTKPVIDGKRECVKCHIVRPISDFPKYKNPRNKSLYHARCRECIRIKSEAYRLLKPARYKNLLLSAHLQSRFGISLEEYKTLERNQNNKCAICGNEETRKAKDGLRRLSVDHDHKTGKIRSLLCHGCNAGIGLFRENPIRLRQAAAYFETVKAGGPC